MGQEQAGIDTQAAAISFTIAGMRFGDVVKRLGEKDIALRNGYFYALHCLEGLGIGDTADVIIRVGLAHCNSE